MNNLYVYAIGGTGERVMKSLVMMMAAGVKLGANKVVPIFIDNDAESKALTECKFLIDSYRNERYGFRQVCTQFNGVTFAQTEIAEPIVLDRAGGSIGSLDRMIEVPILDENDADFERKREEVSSISAERDLLFTSDDRAMPLNRGFVGRPNVGAVVMNTDSLKDLDITYSDGDGLIVIGSLFGGTGASGIPLIINKNCHLGETDADTNRPMIGAVAVLPYFNCERRGNSNIRQQQDADIDGSRYNVKSSNFNIATRAALRYYDTYMKKHYDRLYYVGDDDKRSNYSYCVGGIGQDNPTNLVEVMGALSIVNFSNLTRKNHTIEYEQPQWGFDVDATPVSSNLSDVLELELRKALVRFKLMQLCFTNDNILKKALDEHLPAARDLTADILKSVNDHAHNGYERAKGLKYLLEFWNKWCKDLENESPQPHQRNFRFFDKAKANSDANEILTAFYTNSELFGIAKTIIQGVFRRTEQPAPIKFLSLLLEARNKCKELSDPNHQVEDAKKLGATMLMISTAADIIINEHSTVDHCESNSVNNHKDNK